MIFSIFFRKMVLGILELKVRIIYIDYRGCVLGEVSVGCFWLFLKFGYGNKL